MELEEFVSEAILGIIRGVRSAQKVSVETESGAWIAPSDLYPGKSGSYVTTAGEKSGSLEVQNVEFDIAVTATQSSQSKGGVGVLVAAVGIGGSKQTGVQHEATSRIKFSVPIAFPPEPNDPRTLIPPFKPTLCVGTAT